MTGNTVQNFNFLETPTKPGTIHSSHRKTFIRLVFFLKKIIKTEYFSQKKYLKFKYFESRTSPKKDLNIIYLKPT